jgi:2-succinyl-5-enolpyruvyl-6-hydroxy-3-cyclohexene-1-carboxylate synthase
MSATDLARSIIRGLLEIGISDFVISPGSRNAPLTMAIVEASNQGLADLHTRLDERGAAFYALGVAKATNEYVVVICTSGTAVANYHPAALEAYHSDIKVIFLTADRPARLRATGANQTTLQAGLLAPLPSFDTARALDLPEVLDGGPVHINLQFEEPLLPTDSTDWLAGLQHSEIAEEANVKATLEVATTGVLIVGHDRAGFSIDEIKELADILDWPLVSEDPLTFPESIAHASVFLAQEDIRQALAAPEIIVIGRTTLSRSINSFIAESERVIVIDPRIEFIDTSRSADVLLTNIPHITKASTPESFIELWQSASRSAAKVIETDHIWSERTALRSIASNLPDGSALFVGSSRPIRDIEGFAQPRTGLAVFANRGLAGIDGNIATAFGIASRFERSYAVMGDLTFLHDISAMVNQTSDNLTIFIIDNNGGGIFSTLPQAGVDGFEAIFGTPHDLNIEKVIAGFGISVVRVKSASDIEANIAHESEGLHCVIVEVPDRESNAAALKEIYQSVASAVRIGINLA